MLTKEQVLQRRNYLGASEAAAVLGLSRWKTPLQVWSEKTGAVEPEDISDRLPVIVGNELEDLVCKLFTRETGKKVYRVNETIRHPAYPFIAANLDRRVVGEDAVLEAKTANARKLHEWEDDEIPQEYLVQVMHQLAVTGRQFAYIAVLIGGNQKFIWKKVERDEDIIKNIVEKECEFWLSFVQPKVMPKVVTAQDSAILNALFPSSKDGDNMVLGSDADRIIEDIKTLDEQAKKLTEEAAKLKNELKLMIGNFAGGSTEKWKVSWKEVEKAAYTVPQSKNRVMRITAIKRGK